MYEFLAKQDREKRLWGIVAGVGLLVTAGSVLYLDKHEVHDPQDAFFTVTRLEDNQRTLTHVDEIEVPVAIAGLGGIITTALAAGAFLEISREQSSDDNATDQL